MAPRTPQPPAEQASKRSSSAGRTRGTLPPKKKAGARQPEAASTWKTVAAKLDSALGKPQMNYIVILTVTMLLTGLGLVMVLSSSMVNSRASGGSVYSEFLRQAVIVAVGLIGMWVAMRIRPQTMRKISPYLMMFAFALLVAVLIPGIGVGGDEVGSNSWIRVGSVGIQPSEAAKLALAVWGSATVASRLSQTVEFRKALGPLLSAGALFLLLVLMQKDLGMMMSVGVVLLALVFFAGLNTRVFWGLLAIIAAVVVVAIVLQAYRSARITTWMDTFLLRFSDSSTQGSAYQSHQGILSLSDGGLTGLGLGQSRAKWFYLPEATNDFIFAVIGEELGFVGALAVVLLFALLGWFGIRCALAHTDPFMRMLAATLTLGVVVQAFINMGYVVGFLPVTGIQLPLISAGGTSAVITLVSMGLLANCARHEPETVSSMQHEGRPFVDRLLMLPEPLPVVAGSERRMERRTTTQRYGEPVTRQRGGVAAEPVEQDDPGYRRGRQNSRSRIPGRMSQDVRRERDRVQESRRRLGTDGHARDYDGRRRSSLPPVRKERESVRDLGSRSTHTRRNNRPDSRRR